MTALDILEFINQNNLEDSPSPIIRKLTRYIVEIETKEKAERFVKINNCPACHASLKATTYEVEDPTVIGVRLSCES